MKKFSTRSNKTLLDVFFTHCYLIIQKNRCLNGFILLLHTIMVTIFLKAKYKKGVYINVVKDTQKCEDVRMDIELALKRLFK